MVLALLLALLVSLVIVAFMVLTEDVGKRFFFPAQDVPWRRLVMPALGAGLSGWLLWRFFPDARGSGIPQTKAALFAKGGVIHLRTAIGKFCCCSLSLGSGIALGREGPSVQIAAGLVSSIARRIGLSEERVVALIPVGTAAAIAAAFNTPIAAVLFTLEEVMGNLHAKVMGAVVIGSAASWMMLHLLLGDEPLFHVPGYQLVTPWEFLLYAVLGVLGGLMSVAFVRLTLLVRARFMLLPKWTVPYQPIAGGLAVGVFAYWLPEVLGVGYLFVDKALNGEMLWQTMLFLVLLKLPLTVACYSSGNAGGIFGPSLFLGAMLGGALGSLAHQALPTHVASPGAYALVGMGTAFAGIIRAPMTSVIMIFELTRDYNIIVPLMISNLIAYVVSERLQEMPVYEALAAQDGIHLPRSMERQSSPDLLVREAMRSTARLTSPERPLLDILSEDGQRTVLIGVDGHLHGVLSGPEIQETSLNYPPNTPIGQIWPHLARPIATLYITNETVPHVHPDHRLEVVLHRLGEFGLDALPVLSRTEVTRVVGEIGLEDLLLAYRLHSGSREHRMLLGH